MSRGNHRHKARIVILGAGFGGAYTFKYLHRLFHRDSRVELILVNRTNYFLFTPLLHEVATGGVMPEVVTEPLRKVLGCCLGDFYLAEIEKVDVVGHRVKTTQGQLPYDYLVLALGATTNFFGVPGAREHTFTLKTLEDAMLLKNHFITTFEQACRMASAHERTNLLRFVVVGGGPTGVELAAEMADLFYGTFRQMYSRSQLVDKVKVILLEASSSLLGRIPPQLGAASLKVLRQKHVEVRLATSVTRVTDSFVELNTGERLFTNTAIWVAGVAPQSVHFTGSVARDERGHLLVEDTLQLPGYPNVFALGDVAYSANPGRTNAVPQLAQVATRQARAVAHNIAALVQGEDPQPYTYRHTGDLVSVGRWNAVAHLKGGLTFSGRFAWWLWRTVYLSKLLSVPKKVRVAVDWTIDSFSPRDISRV